MYSAVSSSLLLLVGLPTSCGGPRPPVSGEVFVCSDTLADNDVSLAVVADVDVNDIVEVDVADVVNDVVLVDIVNGVEVVDVDAVVLLLLDDVVVDVVLVVVPTNNRRLRYNCKRMKGRNILIDILNNSVAQKICTILKINCCIRSLYILLSHTV